MQVSLSLKSFNALYERKGGDIMKLYNVVWEERMSVNVQAKSEEEAIEMVHNCEYDEAGVSSEISTPPEAFEMDEPKK